MSGPPIHEDTMVTVHLEGRGCRLARGSTLADLLRLLGHTPEAITTALNGEFVARALRADHVLQDGDQILLFQPIVGG
ncbi:sulfur carrier protein ThiS [Methylibium petroleiphilum]|uniref:sulfur carrier protein ThiS n=1 Tax=Methylibium petroleiphilum TaxID=105560 RepID=UPI001ACCE6A5|nr:sulfur carrier protein ThiS [Methylibium petroleiphilum]MBN9203983.1 sulfur carrier protein ThiS [Methylibium petroleiphilum]